MVAKRMQLSIMISAEELEHLKNIVNERIFSKTDNMIKIRNESCKQTSYKKDLTSISNDIKIATMLKAKLDVQFS